MSAANTPTAQLPTVTHHRRRADPAEKEKAAADPAQVSPAGEETTGSGAAIRYLASRKRAAESWILRGEECVLSASRKNMGRTVFALLLVALMVSVYVKLSLGGGGGGNIVRTEKEILFIHNFKNDFSSNAHMAVFDSEASNGAALQKRQMKEFPVTSFSFSL